MMIDDAVAQIDTMIHRRMLAGWDAALLDMIAAGVEHDEAEDVITISAEHYDATRPALLAEIRRAIVDAYPSGVVERLTMRTP